MFDIYPIPSASASFSVHAVYIPNGNTSPQYSGVYLYGVRLYKYFHIPSIVNNGIHHVPNDQKNTENPLTNPPISKNGPPIFGMLKLITAPASVVIATAPMLIQYGGTNTSGAILKNINRYVINVIGANWFLLA